jgi:hypothetical protein
MARLPGLRLYNIITKYHNFKKSWSLILSFCSCVNEYVPFEIEWWFFN